MDAETAIIDSIIRYNVQITKCMGKSNTSIDRRKQAKANRFVPCSELGESKLRVYKTWFGNVTTNDIQVCERNTKLRWQNWFVVFNIDNASRCWGVEVLRRSWHFCQNRNPNFSLTLLLIHHTQVSHANHFYFLLNGYSSNSALDYPTLQSALSTVLKV